MEPVSSGTSEATLGTFHTCLDELSEIAIENGIATEDEAKETY